MGSLSLDLKIAKTTKPVKEFGIASDSINGVDNGESESVKALGLNFIRLEHMR